MSSFSNSLAKKLRLTALEIKIFKKLSSPARIQDFVNKLPANFERQGETLMSPRRALRARRAHCAEGALVAALALWLHGQKPLLVDLRARKKDSDHTIAVYRRNKYWGAISKSNHTTVRFRDPVYRSLRELVMSYFHEYFLRGKKTLVSFSKPLDLRGVKENWAVSEKDLWHLDKILDKLPHYPCLPKKAPKLRLIDRIEKKAESLQDYYR